MKDVSFSLIKMLSTTTANSRNSLISSTPFAPNLCPSVWHFMVTQSLSGRSNVASLMEGLPASETARVPIKTYDYALRRPSHFLLLHPFLMFFSPQQLPSYLTALEPVSLLLCFITCLILFSDSASQLESLAGVTGRWPEETRHPSTVLNYTKTAFEEVPSGFSHPPPTHSLRPSWNTEEACWGNHGLQRWHSKQMLPIIIHVRSWCGVS